MLAGAGEDHDPGLDVVAKRQRGGFDVREVCMVQGVGSGRPVEVDDGDVAVPLDCEVVVGLGHGALGWPWPEECGESGGRM